MEIDYGMTGVILEDEDIKNYPVWSADTMHGYPPWCPLYAFNYCDGTSNAFHRATERLSIPETHGFEWKLHNGMVYIAVPEPRPEEVPVREKLFAERMTEFVVNPEEKWAKDKDWLLQRFKAVKEADIEKASRLQLHDFFLDCMAATQEIEEVHFYWMYGLYTLNYRFLDACEELFGMKPNDPIYHKLKGGFETDLYRLDKQAWILGDRARELGLTDLFLKIEDDEQVMAKLEETEVGKKWLDEYLDFVKVHGWRCFRFMDWSEPSWIERPSLGFPDIRRALSKGGESSLIAKQERMVKEREQAERELMARVPAGQREWFGKLMKMAQMSSWWTEDHTPLVEFQRSAVPRKVLNEIGKRFTQAGVIDEPFDIYMLLPWEISRSILILGNADLRRIARWRRGEWQKACQMEHPPFFGQPEKIGEIYKKDPLVRVIVPFPDVRPELKADLYGTASAPGVIEGIARVIMSDKQLTEIQAGEILVAPFTASPWVSVFHLIKGLVTDMGGAMCHAVIVGRDFGLPTVAGTMEGTRKIKTGQRIRVNGDNCAVYFLD